MLDWSSIQATLVCLAEASIREFAVEHKNEDFYGLFLDCNAFYGDVLLHLNTPELLSEQARRYKYDIQSVGGVACSPTLYANKTIAEIEETLRWSGGDWGYFEINRSDKWRQVWDPIRQSICNLEETEALQDEFMNMACRALLQIESCGVLNLLRRTKGFRTICADHDESIEDAAKRLEDVRAKNSRKPRLKLTGAKACVLPGDRAVTPNADAAENAMATTSSGGVFSSAPTDPRPL